MRILVVEDDTILADGIVAGLRLAGLTVDLVGTHADARAALEVEPFDAVVLDIMLPDGSGIELTRSLRARGDRTPILLLTALDDVADRVRGLDDGADDYLGKPFDLDELAARVRAVARRGSGRATPCLAWNDIVLDQAGQSASRNGTPLALSRREFAVLSVLIERPDVIRSKDELESRLYGWQEEVESNTVEVHIHNLRSKIGRDAIETVRGMGYRMRHVPT